MAFPHEPIRPRNVVMLFKAETVVGTDAAPTASDAIPFEAEGWSFNAPTTAEDSDEATGSMIAGAPLIVGQSSVIKLRFRVKGAGAGITYTAGIKPPHHALLQSCGWRGLFSAAITATALASGTTTSATLATPFAATAQAQRGLPLQLAGGTSGGRIAHVTDYTAARVATLADVFGSALSAAATAAMPANWSYALTSPKDAAARVTDQPSGTLYIYEDGRLLKFTACRGALTLSGDTARPGFAEVELMGVFAGEVPASVPVVTVAGHVAPVLAMGDGGINPALVVDRVELATKSWSLNGPPKLETRDDSNTAFGFGAPDLDIRALALGIDPLTTYKANIDRWAQIAAGTQMPAVLRFGNTAGNRWSLVLPTVSPVKADPATRGIYRTDDMSLRAYSPGVDASSRDADAILCFY